MKSLQHLTKIIHLCRRIEDSTPNCASLSDTRNCQQKKVDTSLDTLPVADSVLQKNLNEFTPNADNGVLSVSDACLHEMPAGDALVAKMVKPWESYIGSLWKDLLESLPSWKASGTLSASHWQEI